MLHPMRIGTYLPCLILCLGLAHLACGPSLSNTVPEDKLQRLPKNSRRSVYQAQTVVTIARDKKGTIKRTAENTQREIDRIKEKIKSSKKQLSTVSAAQASRIEGEIEMLRFKIDYLNEVIDHQDERMRLADAELVLAKAQFELAKVQLVKKHSIAFSGTVEEFEKQVRDIQEHVKRIREDVKNEELDLKREEERWLAAKKHYYSSIGESTKGWWTEE